MEVILQRRYRKTGRARPGGEGRRRLRPQFPAAQAAGRGGHRIEQEDRRAGAPGAPAQGSQAEERSRGSGKMLSGVRSPSAQKAGENDQLFGSVTAKDMAEALEKQNFTIDRRKIQLDEPIKQLGEHKVTVRLHRRRECRGHGPRGQRRVDCVLTSPGRLRSSPARPPASARRSPGVWREAGATIAVADLDARGRARGGRARWAAMPLASAWTSAARIRSGRRWRRFWRGRGRIDILVNNAGIAGRAAPLWEQTDEDWQHDHRRQPDGRLQLLPRRDPAHARPQVRPDRQHRLHRRQGGQSEHDRLLGDQGAQ